MYLIPFFIENPKNISLGCKMWKCWVFMTNGGKELWEIPDTPIEIIVKTHFEENNIYGKYIPTTRKDIVLYEIDTKQTCISDFYTWNDILQGTECKHEIWRPFFWVGSTHYGDADEWGWKEGLKDIRIGTFGSVDILWKVLRDSILYI